MLALTFSLAYAGMTGCCLAMPKHYRQVWHVEPASRVSLLLRITGWSLLAASLVVCIATGGAAIGSVTWLGMLSAAGLALIVMLSLQPRVAIWVGPVGAALAIGWNAMM